MVYVLHFRDLANLRLENIIMINGTKMAMKICTKIYLARILSLNGSRFNHFISLPIRSDLCLSCIGYSFRFGSVGCWLLVPFTHQLCTMQCALHTNYALSATYLKSLNKSLCDRCDRQCDRILNREWNRDWYRLDILVQFTIQAHPHWNIIIKCKIKKKKRTFCSLLSLFLSLSLLHIPYMPYVDDHIVSCVHVHRITFAYIYQSDKS